MSSSVKVVVHGEARTKDVNQVDIIHLCNQLLVVIIMMQASVYCSVSLFVWLVMYLVLLSGECVGLCIICAWVKNKFKHLGVFLFC